jgi:hypothetical protein
LLIKVFFSNPAITLSAAISKSFISTSSLFYLAANIAASLQRFAISAPEKPGVNVANLFAHFFRDIVLSNFNGYK